MSARMRKMKLRISGSKKRKSRERKLNWRRIKRRNRKEPLSERKVLEDCWRGTSLSGRK